jgi:hypothetical protein
MSGLLLALLVTSSGNVPGLYEIGSGGSDGITVPFRIGENAIVVDAKVNGRTVSLMFDSGFGGTVVLDQSIDIGPESGHITLRDFVGELTASTVALKSLQLGGLTLHPDEQLVVRQPANFSAAYGRHVDGILGLNAVKEWVTEIDFQHSQFIFYPSTVDISKLVPDGKRTFLTTMLPIGGNAVELAVMPPSGQLMTMALDTGNSFYATSHRDVLERVGLWKPGQEASFMRESGVASGAVPTWNKKMPPMTIFGVPVQSTVWDIIDLPSSDARGDGTIGFGFLRNFNITFDFARRRVWFEKWRDPVENPQVGDVGLVAHFDPQLRRTVIVHVSPGSPAAEAGVKEGDQVLSIASANLDRPTVLELRALFEGPIGSKLAISVSRDGGLKRFNLIRKALDN